MFDEIQREMRRLARPRTISIDVPLDEKGYYDRECPSPECRLRFKVLFNDWREKVRDEQVFCPFCRHEEKATEWNTPEQVEHIKSAGLAEMTRLFQGAMKRGVQRSRPQMFGGGLFNVSMSLSLSPGQIPPVIIAQASEALRQDFLCENCGCRYASLGASFFCPSCGHNSATSSFDTTLETVERTIKALDPVRNTLSKEVDADTAHNAIRQLLEDQFARLVGAFERINESLFEKLPNAANHPRKGAVFQRLDDASTLWRQASGSGYDVLLTASELKRMKLLFQRRHVLSHRQGIVDRSYIDRSGDPGYAVGQRLVTRDCDIVEFVGLLRKLVNALRNLVP